MGCRQRALAAELLRVVARDGHVVVDERRRLPGRGAWLHRSPECLAKAERRRVFPRALRVSGVLATGELRHHLEWQAERSAPPRPVQDAAPGTSRGRWERRKQVDPS
ncbi:hypothetical protein SAMN05421810_104319 [Amycolatopsis arida]|uniref:YlxR domain-containing protein n=1 Tax=Amycolatopsis arida TaxID=587909 RepID=A0A1I5VDA9_9PSEU|nr:hypothetical protein CLV69_106318 [Amycolatopsis arida]SFQ05392.1 hypothetical protein SAMN05421810_104319 [Amycolatopsis arida]